MPLSEDFEEDFFDADFLPEADDFLEPPDLAELEDLAEPPEDLPEPPEDFFVSFAAADLPAPDFLPADEDFEAVEVEEVFFDDEDVFPPAAAEDLPPLVDFLPLADADLVASFFDFVVAIVFLLENKIKTLRPNFAVIYRVVSRNFLSVAAPQRI